MKTPIQELIEILTEQKEESHYSMIAETLRATIELLEGWKTQERQFAETCFDAGQAYGDERNLIGLTPQDSPDFTTFYKQYEK